MLCSLGRSELIKWVIVLDRRCVICRTAWGTRGSYSTALRCEGGTLGAHWPPVDAVGGDDDDRDDVRRRAVFGEHPPFVLFLSSCVFSFLLCLPLSVCLSSSALPTH